MVTAVATESVSIANWLDYNYDVNEDQWIHLILKAKDLAKDIIEFKPFLKNLIDTYYSKFWKLAMTAH